MTLIDSPNGNHAVETPDAGSDPSAEHELRSLPSSPKAVFTRRMLRPRGHLEQNRYVLIAAGAVVVAILVFVAVSMPRGAVHNPSKRSTSDQSQDPAVGNTAGPAEKSLFPIIESQRTTPQPQRDGFLNEVDLERTAKAKPSPNHPQTSQDASGSLGAIPPFGAQENWQAPPYQPCLHLSGYSDTNRRSKHVFADRALKYNPSELLEPESCSLL